MIKKFASKALSLLLLTLFCSPAFASEADLVVPNIKDSNPDFFNYLLTGIGISVIGLIFGFIEFFRIKKLDVHSKKPLKTFQDFAAITVFDQNNVIGAN